MVDPLIRGAASEAAKVGGGVLSRLLGPTADEMGVQLHDWYKRKNVERVVMRAEAKARTGTDGAIPPRVAADVFEKAQWADDDFVAEYLSGVLASARTPDGRDDSAISWTALVGRLSATQLRLHYVLYSLLRALKPDSITGWVLTTRMRQRVVVTLTSVVEALGLDEVDDASLFEAIHGLAREGLIEDVAHGPADSLREQGGDFRGYLLESDDNGLLSFCGTPDGFSLYLWGTGNGRQWIDAFWGPGLECEPDESLDVGQADGSWLTDVEKIGN